MPTPSVVGSARAIFTITLLSAAAEEVRVDWATKDGTALVGRDYEANSGTVTFAPGETSKTVEVFVHGRTVETEDRVFYVLLDPPVNALLADEIGACVIHVDTTGTEPVLTIIIPRGEKGETGDSAYQIALNNGFVGTEAEWLASLRPSPAEIAPLVAPLINAGDMSVTAAGTEALARPDTDTLKGFAGRIAFMNKTKKALAPALTAGTNVVPFGAFVGDPLDPTFSTGFSVAALRGGVLTPLSWEYLIASDEIRITGAVAGDIPIAVQQDIGVGNLSKAPVHVGSETMQLQDWLEASIQADADLLALFANTADPAKGAAKVGRSLQVVGTIAELRTLLKTSPSKYALTVGYYTPGDGGGNSKYRLDLSDTTSADNGGSIIVAADGGRWKFVGTNISFKQFGAKGDFVADDTVRIQAALTFAQAQTISALVTSGSISSSYTGTTPRVFANRGKYKISASLTPGAYLSLDGDEAIIQQVTPGADILAGEAYQWKCRGIIFVGGRHHANMSNANSDSARFDFEGCENHLSGSYAFNTFATGGVWTHMSANLTIRHGRILNCRKVLNNCCDSALLDDVWVWIDKTNFDASSAAFNNDGGATGHARLFFRNMFGVPNMGVEGVDRLANVRWIDNKGSINATDSRFGGESGGIPITFEQKSADRVAPYLGRETVFTGCWLYAGQSNRSDSGVIVLDGHIPQLMKMDGCIGPSDVPFIINPSSFSIPAYIAAWEAATLQKAYKYFRIDVGIGSSGNTDGTIYNARIPVALRPYLVKCKMANLLRAATQPLTTGFGINNFVSFDNVISDNAGVFAAATPTRIFMPAGCTRMAVSINVGISTDGAAKAISVELIDASNLIVAGEAMLRGINPSVDRFSITKDLEGASGSYWQVNIRHNAAGTLSLLSASVSARPLDLIG